MHDDIQTYIEKLTDSDQAICKKLRSNIDTHLPHAESKLWHGHPVWFLAGNPVVGFSKLKDSVQLLFWRGQSFDEPELKPEGTFKAAQARFTHVDQIDTKKLIGWLEKAQTIQWDYKNIVKHKGKLERIV